MYASSVDRGNYISFESERRPRESTFKGIAMTEMKREGDSPEKEREQGESF